MDVRVLRYFLAVAREQTISGAAEVLHMTQPRCPSSCGNWRRNWANSCFTGASGGSP